VDGQLRSEYSSASLGTKTHVDFDFGQSMPVAGFRHRDRADPATVASSRLTFSDSADFADVLGTVEVEHANTRGGETTVVFPRIAARFVRWQVTQLGPQQYGTVGGAEIGFFAAGRQHAVPEDMSLHFRSTPALLRDGDRLRQPLAVSIDYPYAEPSEATIEVAGGEAVPVNLKLGLHTIPLPALAAVDQPTPVEVIVRLPNQVRREAFVLQPVRPWELWFLPHSHNDIGYTHVQTEVEHKQWQYLEEAVALARRTADYPAGSQFKWNAEVIWAVDSYLQQASPERRGEFIEAVRSGRIGLDALYGNELTGLCRPEELFRLMDGARRIAGTHNLRIDAAMISDVPGYTWGIVPALAHSGVRYLSVGPNHIHRIGYTLAEWADKPFWWVSPSGQERVLCWVAGQAYSWFHPGLLGAIQDVPADVFFQYLERLQTAGYPYDMVQIRYSIAGDNGPPDPDLPEYVRRWNAAYAWPRMRIATTGELMGEFERRYGDKLPEFRGDFTPYWEDGAASSALETSLARGAAERLVQAETLWALLAPERFPDVDSYAAWRNTLLYNEHTWGAHCSITQPDSPFTLDQWKIKQAFALDADRQSQALLAGATAVAARTATPAEAPVAAVDVYNTCSWPRTDLVVLPADWSLAGDLVQTAAGQPVASQRLSDGRLAFLAEDVAPLGATRFLLRPGSAAVLGRVQIDDDGRMANASLSVAVDARTGAVASLMRNGHGEDLASGERGFGLNAYFYVAGRDPAQPQTAGPAQWRVIDRGPLVATLAVDSPAPGCRTLARQLRLVAGLDFVELTNVVDKQPVRSPESVHFGFDPQIPEGVMRMDIPWAVIRPEVDQLPGACKNYFSVGRWVDVSNDQYGLSVATVDAPLVEVGAIRVDVASPFQPEAWIRQLEPTQTFYSYVMNNYWETNYKASQEGPTPFRYALRPHGPFDAAETSRFGLERSQPLVIVPVEPSASQRASLLCVEPRSVIVTSVKPSRDGRALIVRLFNTGEQTENVALDWGDPQPKRVTLSSPFEDAGALVTLPVSLPSFGIVTLRAEVGD